MILCCGEALIDMLPMAAGDQTGFAPHPGGAVFNTSIALGRLGQSTALLSGLSTDLFGQQLCSALDQSGVETGMIARSDRPTTLAFVQLVDGHATYRFYDENSAGRMVLPGDFAVPKPEITTLFLGGISLASEPSGDSYADYLAAFGATRAVMVDPNIRPAFVADEARYRARLERVFAQADIVKVSDEDLTWIYPGDLTEGERVTMLLDCGIALVIVTRGRDGATGFLSNGRSVTVPAILCPVVDTVGAGDTFNAGVLAKLNDLGLLTKSALGALNDDQVSAALTHGARVASVTVSRAGADAPWAHELGEPA